jgi:hypothetical protein
MDVRSELERLGFQRAGAMTPCEDGRSCRAVMDREFTGFVVYAHVVEEQIKKFGTTKAPLRGRVSQNASTITQVIALSEGRATHDAAWHHRPFDTFKRSAPEVIKKNVPIEVWAIESTEAEYKLLERDLNARFDTMRTGWTMQLG